MPRIKLTVETEIDLDVDTAAKWFAGLDDDQQTQFIVAVAREMNSWGPTKMDYQLSFIGGHLRNCECSTDGAREFVKQLAYYTETSEHN